MPGWPVTVDLAGTYGTKAVAHLFHALEASAWNG